MEEVILDGEVDWGGSNGGYHLFDILCLNGHNLMPLPLMERRAILRDLGQRSPLHPVAEITGENPWDQACREGWEGVIAKRRDSPYEHRQSRYWLKMNCEALQDWRSAASVIRGTNAVASARCC